MDPVVFKHLVPARDTLFSVANPAHRARCLLEKDAFPFQVAELTKGFDVSDVFKSQCLDAIGYQIPFLTLCVLWS